MRALLTPMLIPCIVAILSAGFGLHLADKAALPMPLLRAFELGQPLTLSPMALRSALLAGGVLGLAGLAAMHGFNLPDNPGSRAARLLSTFFAAITLELVLHLFVMSAVTRWTRRPCRGGVIHNPAPQRVPP